MLFARWALFASALSVIGGLGAAIAFAPVRHGVARAARSAAFAMVIATVLLLGAQLQLWFGAEGFTDPENLRTLLLLTLWGLHWTWLAVAAVTCALLWSAAVRWPALTRVAAPVAAALAVITVPLVGHGSTSADLSAVWHRLHLAGAGLWIGTLAVTTLGHADDPSALLVALRRFAPVAFTGAVLTVIAGAALSWQHMRPLSTFWTTDYGRVLAMKMAGALAIGAAGFVNWRHPRTRAIALELAVAFIVVLVLTAWLADLEPPVMAH
jgi:putative copper export protein